MKEKKQCCEKCAKYATSILLPKLYTGCKSIDCECHIPQTEQQELKTCVFDHRELPNCDICRNLGCNHELMNCGTDDEKLLEDMKKNPSKITTKGKKVLSIFSQTKPQEQDWEKEFEKEFCDENHPDWIMDTQRAWRIKSFIRSLLQKQKDEAIREGYNRGRTKFMQQHNYVYKPDFEAELKERIKKELINVLKVSKTADHYHIGIARVIDSFLAISEAVEIVEKIK